MEKGKQISRRKFLERAAQLTVGAAATMACAQQAPAPSSNAPAAAQPTTAAGAAPAPGAPTVAAAAKPTIAVTRAEVKEIKIGGIYPLTGPSASTGVDLTNGYKLALEIINGNYPDLPIRYAKGEGLPNFPGAKLNVVFGDHQDKPEKGASEAERLITQEKVPILVGCYNSNVTAPTSQVAERMSIPFLDPDAVSPTLMQRGFKWFFRITVDTQIWNGGPMFERFVPDLEKQFNTKIKRILLFSENSLAGTDMNKYAKENAPKHGYEIAGEILYPPRTTSLVAEIQKAKTIDADLVYGNVYIAEAILFVKTAKDLDWNYKAFVSAGGFRSPAWIDAVKETGNFTWQLDEFSPDLAKTRPLVEKANKLYKDKFGTNFTTDSARTFQALFVVADAINTANSLEPAKIRDALRKVEFPPDETVPAWDGIKFDEKGQNIYAKYLVNQLINQQWRLAWPFQATPVKPVYPKPEWSKMPTA